MTFYFNFTLRLFSKHRGTKAGWGSTDIEIDSRFGWNFFTRTRHWDEEMKELLPPVIKFRLRKTQYYHETQEKVWNFLEKKYDYYWKFEDKAYNYPQVNKGVRLVQVVYRLPLITLTNTYHTGLDEVRHEEFLKELDKPIE